ncbi:hypothetical protein BDZ91DRAFT_713950 [Kalaharituber pfeilii]|nr:hypothetical protein BDZ91DRAFT_713950 [Kalaharituber pfeilii]
MRSLAVSPTSIQIYDIDNNGGVNPISMPLTIILQYLTLRTWEVQILSSVVMTFHLLLFGFFNKAGNGMVRLSYLMSS